MNLPGIDRSSSIRIFEILNIVDEVVFIRAFSLQKNVRPVLLPTSVFLNVKSERDDNRPLNARFTNNTGVLITGRSGLRENKA